MPVKVFLSTVSDEFRDYRDQLRHDLTRHNVEVKVQEDFKDYGGVTLDKLDLYIVSCDAVVHLVGEMMGAAARPESTKTILTKYPDLPARLPALGEALTKGISISYTQWEAWLAIYHGKPLLIAQAANSAPRGPKYSPTDASRDAQQAHLARLRMMERYPGSTFGSPDQLAKEIAYTSILDRLAEEGAKARAHLFQNVSTREVLGALAILMLAPLVADQWSKTLGVALAAPLVLFLALGMLALALVYARYFGLLGAGDAPAGSQDRRAYDLMRANLAGSGPVTQIYSRWLKQFLDSTDRFFGDASMGDRTLFPHAFGLRTPAPLWTAAAFDRCLLLALVYPIVTIYVLWAASSHVGPAENSLGLPPNLPGWRRGILVAVVGFCALGFSRVVLAHARGINPIRTNAAFALAVFLPSVVVLIAIGGINVFAFAVAGSLAIGVGGALAGGFSGAFALAQFIGVVAALAVGGVAAPVAYLVVVFGVGVLSSLSRAQRWEGAFLVGYVAAMVAACLLTATALQSTPTWIASKGQLAPFVLIVGLLTLLNAPFDWASLGVTRALLRRGLELGGWWPFVLALVDALLAGIIVALLALTMMLGVQTFDAMIVHSGGQPVLALPALFDGIAASPAEPEYWWVYVLLLSTMLPSLFNLVIGSTALMRGLPGSSSLLLRFLPEACAAPTYDRAWIATALTAQIALGVVLGVAAQGILAYALLLHLMPAVGLGLLDICRGLADLDLPARLIKIAVAAW